MLMKLKINNIYTTKSESDGYSETVYSFQWNFENTYDDKTGIVDVIFVKSYKPEGIYVSLYMKQNLSIGLSYKKSPMQLVKEGLLCHRIYKRL